MKFINNIVLLLVIIGAINWGIIGFFNIDLVKGIFSPLLSRIIFAIIGLAGLWAISFFKPLTTCRHHPGGICAHCKNDCKDCTCCRKW